ncbi:glyoxylase-like metal-dependent hydrolase (beta-lactamase superfamily II) [Rhizobium leguminosarum]|nr:glyoxylase-like metal-dependent hydrolase (beta-lactamase superfamily II) [Rhizobium leguminosarum]
MAISTRLKRRTLLAAGLGLLAAPTILREKAEATATGENNTMNALPLPEINQFKLGSYKFTVVRDGINISEKPHETYGTDQDPETVKSLLTANFLPADKLVNGYAPALIDTGSDVMLIDTGFGASGRARGTGQLTEGLKTAGYSADDVTLVALTHLHGDHIGGLMENGAPAFRNARYVIGQTEYDFWSNTAREGTPAEGGHKAVLANVTPLVEKVAFIKDGDRVAPGVTAILAAGHSPGHMVSTSNPRASAWFSQAIRPTTTSSRCCGRIGRYASTWTRRRPPPPAARSSR